MNPEIVGNGKGKQFMETILNMKELKNKLIELKVRAFNKRAINCYLSVGFKIVDKINTESVIDDEFYIMHKIN